MIKLLSAFVATAMLFAIAVPASASTISAQTSTGYTSTHGELNSVEVDKSNGKQVTDAVSIAWTHNGNSCGSGCTSGTLTVIKSKTTTDFSTYNKTTFDGDQNSYNQTCGVSISSTPW